MQRRPFLQTMLALPMARAFAAVPKLDAEALHDQLLTVDTHCDTPLRLVGDLASEAGWAPDGSLRALKIDAPWQPNVVTPEGLQAKVAEIRGDWK